MKYSIIVLVLLLISISVYNNGFLNKSSSNGNSDTNVSTAISVAGAVENYGNPNIMWSLADSEVGTYANSVVFPFSKTLISVRKYFVFVPGSAGGPSYYHDGDGGTLRFSIQGDDGSSTNRPNGIKLAETNHIIGGPQEPNGTGGLYGAGAPPSGAPGAIYGCDATDDANFREVCFLSPLAISAGQIYHLVVENTSSSPLNNFVSMNDMHLNNGTLTRDPQTPVYNDLDFRVSYIPTTGGAWIDKPRVAIVEYIFSDGTTWGQGYMAVTDTEDSPSWKASKWLNNTQDIRQTFTPSTNLALNSVNIAAMHFSGSNSIAAKINNSSGTTLWSGNITGFPTGTLTGNTSNNPHIAEAEPASVARFAGLAASITLTAGQSYELILESNGGQHVIFGSRDGAAANYFSQQTTINGAAYVGNSTTNDWTYWDIRGTPVSQYDISFYLGIGNTATISPPSLTVMNNICPSLFGSFSVVTNCGLGSSIQYSVDSGTTWSNSIPVWSDDVSVLARCVDNIDETNISINSNIVTAVLQECTSPCGTGNNIISPPGLAVANNVCPSTQGSFSVPTNCGDGSSIQYSIDNGMTWGNSLPLWADNIALISRCLSNADNTCYSINSNVVTAVLQECTSPCGTTSKPCFTIKTN